MATDRSHFSGLLRIRAAVGEYRRLQQHLPSKVAFYFWRARRLARARDDEWALRSATRMESVERLLELANGYENVVELGTAIGWTTGAFALASPRRHVTSYDPFDHDNRHDYLGLLSKGVRDRITLVTKPGSSGPMSDQPVDLLFIDSSHERDETVAEFRAWEPAIRPGGTVVFDDHLNPAYPGVTEAITEDLGLKGRAVDPLLFVWVKPG